MLKSRYPIFFLSLPSFLQETNQATTLLSNTPLACSEERIQYTCTVKGNIVHWNIPGGEFSLIWHEGSNTRHGSETGNYEWELLAYEMDHLQSLLSFNAEIGLRIGCRGRDDVNTTYMEVAIEGLFIYTYFKTKLAILIHDIIIIIIMQM